MPEKGPPGSEATTKEQRLQTVYDHMEPLKHYRRYPTLRHNYQESLYMRPSIAIFIDLQLGARELICSSLQQLSWRWT